jgi:small subunit ribosomal protein S14
MAKKSIVHRNIRRQEKAARYSEHRNALRKAAADVNLSDEERFEAGVKLQKLPRNTSPTRVVSRCRVTGRPRGVLKKFQMSRITFREMASRGLIPGVTKSSW